MKLYIKLLLPLFLTGCMPKRHPTCEAIKFKDKVTVTTGFYKGATGIVLEQLDNDYYRVSADAVGYVDIHCSELKLY